MKPTHTYEPANSSVIRKVEWRKDAGNLAESIGRLDVTFANGKVYRYDGVREYHYLGIEEAESAGNYFLRD